MNISIMKLIRNMKTRYYNNHNNNNNNNNKNNQKHINPSKINHLKREAGKINKINNFLSTNQTKEKNLLIKENINLSN